MLRLAFLKWAIDIYDCLSWALHEATNEVPDPGPAVNVMLPHGTHQHIDHIGLVGPPQVPAAATVVEFLHTLPLTALFPT